VLVNESAYIPATVCPDQAKEDFEQAKDSGIQAMKQRNYAAAESALNQA
jgi:hypothetical protein